MKYSAIYQNTVFEGMSEEDLHNWWVNEVVPDNPDFTLFPSGAMPNPDGPGEVKARPNATVIRIMKRSGLSEQQIKNATQTTAHKFNSLSLVNPNNESLIHPNKVYGPISYEQKLVIREHLQDENSNTLSQLYNTNISNIKAAQQGRFKQTTITKKEPLANPTPLSLAEKIYIRDNCQNDRPTDIAREYNTSVSNVCIALNGSFKERTQKAPPTRPYGPLTQAEKEHIYTTAQHRTITDIATEYNTNHGNVRNALNGRFKSDSMRDRQLECARALPRDIIEEVYNER